MGTQKMDTQPETTKQDRNEERIIAKRPSPKPRKYTKPKRVIKASFLKMDSLGLLTFLLLNRQGEFVPTDTLTPIEIGKRLGCDDSTVNRRFNDLRELGYLTITYDKDPVEWKQRHRTYRLTDKAKTILTTMGVPNSLVSLDIGAQKETVRENQPAETRGAKLTGASISLCNSLHTNPNLIHQSTVANINSNTYTNSPVSPGLTSEEERELRASCEPCTDLIRQLLCDWGGCDYQADSSGFCPLHKGMARIGKQ